MNNKLFVALIAAFTIAGSVSAASSAYKIVNKTDAMVTVKVSVVSWLCSDQTHVVSANSEIDGWSGCCLRGFTVQSPEYLEADVSNINTGAGISCNLSSVLTIYRDPNTKRLMAVANPA